MGAKASPESLQGAALAIFSDAAGIAEFVFPRKQEQHFLKRRGPGFCLLDDTRTAGRGAKRPRWCGAAVVAAVREWV